MRYIHLIFIVLLAACAVTTSQAKGPNQVATTPRVELTASIEELSIDAMGGDGKAAAQLTDYYMYEKNEDPKWKEWALIGAENGYAPMQLLEYSTLAESTDPLYQRRAFYWLKKSADAGDASAIAIMKTCYPAGSYESRNPKCAQLSAK